MIYYDPMELSDLLVRLKESQKKDSEGVARGKMVYYIISQNRCDWDSVLEHSSKQELKNAIPTLFCAFEDIPLMINNITDSEDEVILQWRLDLGK